MYKRQFLDGGIVYKRHFHIAVEELGKHEILCRQIGGITCYDCTGFARQILSQCVIATIGGRYAVAPVPLGERERDALLGSICVHNTFDLGRTIPSKSKNTKITAYYIHGYKCFMRYRILI